MSDRIVRLCDVDEKQHERKNIEQYVLSQAPELEVTHSQRILKTKVLGRDHEVWDVHTTGERFWVITNPTNLYDQAQRPSYDETLSFHVGIMVRMMERDRTELPEESEGPVTLAWSKFEQGVTAYRTAHEAEELQGVGIHCREALISLAGDIRTALADVELVDPPKNANFKGWADLAAEKLTDGRMRSYLKVLCEKAWDLTVWLQHNANATPWDADLVLDATSNAITTTGAVINRHERGFPGRCPGCGSYRIDEDGEIDEDDNDVWHSRMVCARCERVWNEHSRRWDETTHSWSDIA